MHPQLGLTAMRCLASSFAMGPALKVERVPWSAGAVRGVEWPPQTARLCISYPPQGEGFMQPRIWTRNRVQIHRFEMGGKGGARARAHTISSNEARAVFTEAVKTVRMLLACCWRAAVAISSSRQSPHRSRLDLISGPDSRLHEASALGRVRDA